MSFEKGQSGNPRGRPKGAKNKATVELKEAILTAAHAAGGEQGLIGYLMLQAMKNPAPFLALLGKVLPMTLAGDPDNPVIFEEIRRVLVGSDLRDQDSEDIRPATH